MTKIHLDTDIGGDMDDLCALAMLLKWPDLEITGVTTTADENGRRAGYARYVLDLMGQTDTPVAAGADMSDGYFRFKALEYPPDNENWPEPINPLPGNIDEALTLLKSSIEQGAIVVGIGPFTNFRLLDEKYPGILKQAQLYLMGGYIYDVPPRYLRWDKTDDWNIQLDIQSAQYVLEHANPTLITLTVSGQTSLRRAYLAGLAQTGHLGELIVRQAEVCARSYHNEKKLRETAPALPPDTINFQHDPLACAVALGWREGVEIETVPLKLETRDTFLYEIPDDNGIPTRVVTQIDGSTFSDYWYRILTQ